MMGISVIALAGTPISSVTVIFTPGPATVRDLNHHISVAAAEAENFSFTFASAAAATVSSVFFSQLLY
jgi:hypothetical protein